MRHVLVTVLCLVVSALAHAGDDLCKRADDPSFSPKQRAFIAAAQEYLERKDGHKLDACFDVQDGKSGHVVVVVLYVVGYRNGEPQFIVGGHVGVEMDSNRTVLRLQGGA